MIKKKDILYKIMKISKKYFMKILNKLCIKNMLLRRKIELKEYIIALYYINDQKWTWKYIIQDEWLEKHIDRKFKNIHMIIIFNDIYNRMKSWIILVIFIQW